MWRRFQACMKRTASQPEAVSMECSPYAIPVRGSGRRRGAVVSAGGTEDDIVADARPFHAGSLSEQEPMLSATPEIPTDPTPESTFSIRRTATVSLCMQDRNALLNPSAVLGMPPDQVVVADKGRDMVHAYCVSTGAAKWHIGGTGSASGQFLQPTCLANTSRDTVLVGELGGLRLQEFQAPDGAWLRIIELGSSVSAVASDARTIAVGVCHGFAVGSGSILLLAYGSGTPIAKFGSFVVRSDMTTACVAVCMLPHSTVVVEKGGRRPRHVREFFTADLSRLRPVLHNALEDVVDGVFLLNDGALLVVDGTHGLATKYTRVRRTGWIEAGTSSLQPGLDLPSPRQPSTPLIVGPGPLPGTLLSLENSPVPLLHSLWVSS